MKFLVFLFLNFYFFGLLLKNHIWICSACFINKFKSLMLSYVVSLYLIYCKKCSTGQLYRIISTTFFCKFNCRCKYDICKQIINLSNLPNVNYWRYNINFHKCKSKLVLYKKYIFIIYKYIYIYFAIIFLQQLFFSNANI